MTGYIPNFNRYSGLIKRRVDVVNRNRVIRVCRVAAHVNDDTQTTRWTSGSDRLVRDKVRDLGGEVDAVDKDIDWNGVN